MPTPKNSRGNVYNKKKKENKRRIRRKASFFKYALHNFTGWMGTLKKIGIEPEARDKALLERLNARKRKSLDESPGS